MRGERSAKAQGRLELEPVRPLDKDPFRELAREARVRKQAEAAARRKRTFVTIAALLVVVSGAGLWHVLTRPTDERDRIRAVIDAVELGVEERDVSDVIDHVSEAYKDRSGFNRRDVQRMLTGLFFTKGAIHIQRVGSTDVEMGPDGLTANVHFRAVVTEGKGLALLENADDQVFDVSLRKEDDGAWRITGHKRSRP